MTDYPRQSKRDLAITAVFEGFFGCGWFGWGQSAAPDWLHAWLGIGSALAAAVAVIGVAITRRQPASTSALNRDRAAQRRWGIAVVIEFGLAGLGALALGLAGQAPYIPVLVCAVVAVHFFPLVSILRNRSYIALGAVLCAVTVTALAFGLGTRTAPSTVTGIGAGCTLLAFGATALARAVRTSAQQPQLA